MLQSTKITGSESRNSTNKRFYYNIFCLSIISEIPIPSLKELPESDRGDVVVRIVKGKLEKKAICSNYFIFEKEQVSIEIIEGKIINFYLKKTIGHNTLAWFFIHNAILVILYQRKFLVLHGSSISIGTKAFAFIGNSGIGKSTTAAYFREAGYQYLGDEICAIKTETESIIYPSYPEIGLWPDSAKYLNSTFSFPRRDRPYLKGKADFQVGKGFQTTVAPLKKLFLLTASSESKFMVRPIQSGEAVHFLNENSLLYLSYIKAGRFYKSHFQACLRLLETVELFLVERPLKTDNRKTMLELIESHF